MVNFATQSHWLKKKVFFKTFVISSLLLLKVHKHRGSRPEMFCEKCVLKNLSKFTGKNLCRSLIFSKVAGYVCNKIKKRLCHFGFLAKLQAFEKSLRTPILGNIYERLLLEILDFIRSCFTPFVYEWRL